MANNTTLQLQKEYFIALFNSIKYKDHLKYTDSTKAYFDNRYLEILREELKDIDSKELGGADNPDKKVKICSLASSGRLCFLDFKDHKNGLEKAIRTGVGSSAAKMDVVVSNTYYECKCQEIVRGERQRLKASYLESTLFKDFQIRPNRCKIGNKGEVEFALRELGIDSEKMYYELHFNVKQLICHLMAIANENKGKRATLQYIIYTPAKSEIDKSERLKELYDTLKEEMDAIWHSGKIRDFCDKKMHNIDLAKPQFKDISEIEDIVYCRAYNVKS